MTPKDIPVKAEKEDLVSASCRRDERERPAAALAMTAGADFVVERTINL